MKKSGYLKLFLTLTLLGVIAGYLWQNKMFSLIREVKLLELMIYILVVILGSYLAGIQLSYLVKVTNKARLALIDQIILPVAMALWGYIIPTNGGILYSMLFLKQKYKVKYAEGFSFGLFSIYISLFLTSIFGLYYEIEVMQKPNLIIILLLMILILSPYLLYFVNFLLQKFDLKKYRLIHRIQNFIDSTIANTNQLFKNRQAVAYNTLLIIAAILIHIFTTYWSIHMFGFDIPLSSIVLMVLLLRLSSLVRIVPGNLGIDELVMGGIWGLIGLRPADGVFISFFMRVVTIGFIILPLGVLHTFINFRHFPIVDTLKNLKK